MFVFTLLTLIYLLFIINRTDPFGERSHGVPWTKLVDILTSHGEKIDMADLDTYLGALTGETASSVVSTHQHLDAKAFATQILGFEM